MNPRMSLLVLGVLILVNAPSVRSMFCRATQLNDRGNLLSCGVSGSTGVVCSANDTSNKLWEWCCPSGGNLCLCGRLVYSGWWIFRGVDSATCLSTKKARLHGNGATGDPHFQGFGGGVFSFLGREDGVFALLSDNDFQLNSRFVKASYEIGHEGTYMGDFGIRTPSHAIELATNGSWWVDGVEMASGASVEWDDNSSIAQLPSVLQPVRAAACVRREKHESDGTWVLSVADDERHCLSDKGIMFKFSSPSDCRFALDRPDQYTCHTPAFVHSVSSDMIVFPRWSRAWRFVSARFITTFSTVKHNLPHFDFKVDIRQMSSDWLLPHGVLGQTTDGLHRQFLGDQGEGSIEGHWTDYEVSHMHDVDFAYSRFQSSLRGPSVDLSTALPNRHGSSVEQEPEGEHDMEVEELVDAVRAAW